MWRGKYPIVIINSSGYKFYFIFSNQKAVLDSAKKRDGFTGNGYTRFVVCEQRNSLYLYLIANDR